MDEAVDTGFAEVLTNPNAVWREPSDGAIYAAVSRASTPPEEQASLDEHIAAVTATVTNPVALTPDGVQAAKELLQLPILTAPMLARLARELAMDIRSTLTILKDYNLNRVQYDFLRANNEFFKAALAASTIEWNSAMSTPDRIKIQAAAALEDKLPDLAIRMGNKSEGLPGVVEAAKLFAKIAGVGEREMGAVASGERFSIVINLGADEKLTIGAPQDISPTGAGKARAGHVSVDAEAQDRAQALRPIAQGQGSSETFRLVATTPSDLPEVRGDTKK
jgi:hypothetical protein